jgi:pimeloyl-ACP methyl ester carboxylesterase
VSDLALYHEIHGARRPLVLLHGAMSTIETSFEFVLPEFAKTQLVIAIEQQAHGRAPMILTFLNTEDRKGGDGGQDHRA